LAAKARRRKSRRRLNPGPIFVLLLIVNLVMGYAYSPLLSTVKVRALGVPEWDRARIGETLKKLQDKPWSKVDEGKLEDEILEEPAVRSATLKRNLFGRAELRLTYRVPVAVLARPNNVGIDKEGVVFALHEPAPNLPTLIPPSNAWANEMTLAGSWPRTRIMDVCEAMPEIFPQQAISVNAANPDSVRLNNGSAATIILGGTKDLPKKFEALRKLLRNQPELLQNVGSINVSSPDNIATGPKGKSD